MDVPLQQLAAVSEAVGRAEDAVEEEAWTTARQALDDVDRQLEELREAYRALGPRERGTLGAIAGPLRARRDAVAGRVPKPQAVSDGAPVHDPEQDEDEDGGAPAA
jgi:signal transduction histidine kinase